eukprot:COSAG04_NODE_9618_length_847_cov_0.957219_1_plen_248_part_10
MHWQSPWTAPKHALMRLTSWACTLRSSRARTRLPAAPGPVQSKSASSCREQEGQEGQEGFRACGLRLNTPNCSRQQMRTAGTAGWAARKRILLWHARSHAHVCPCRARPPPAPRSGAAENKAPSSLCENGLPVGFPHLRPKTLAEKILRRSLPLPPALPPPTAWQPLSLSAQRRRSWAATRDRSSTTHPIGDGLSRLRTVLPAPGALLLHHRPQLFVLLRAPGCFQPIRQLRREPCPAVDEGTLRSHG